jgi:hypothetical protein
MPKPNKKNDIPNRAGIPARDSILKVIDLGPGARYRIIRTTEMDEYEKGAALPQTAAAAKAAVAVPTGDNYQGTDRKASKLSIATGKMEKFGDLQALIQSLAPESEMVNHKPKISITATSGRVSEENRNVQVTAYIYAASKESDNDFHLIIGRDPKATPEMYMTMELSGLPPSASHSFGQLNTARDTFKKFYADNLGGTLPGAGYDFPDPPIPVQIEGSLFFDMTHAKGSRPGPKSLKSRMPVIWEVHPITKITFEP